MEELQRRLDQALESKEHALRRQEDLSIQLLRRPAEVERLRQELSEARAEVARLQTELEMLGRKRRKSMEIMAL